MKTSKVWGLITYEQVSLATKCYPVVGCFALSGKESDANASCSIRCNSFCFEDWLNVEFDQMNATVTDVHVGRNWLMNMGAGAEKNGINIQYCMATSRSALQSLEIPVVTHVRATSSAQ